jgi:hypothetical protein
MSFAHAFTHRSRHRSGLHTALAFIFASVVAATAAVPAFAIGGSEFVRLTNVYRASAGLPALSLHAGLDQIAVERANQMAANDAMEHDLAYVQARLNKMGICWSRLGENIAWESGHSTHSYQRTVDQWWGSTGHRANMLGDYNVAGGSWTVAASGRTYSVMLYMHTCGATTAAVAGIGTAVFVAGSHTGYRFSGTTIVSTKTATLASTSGAPVSQRSRIGGKTYLRVTDGIWDGYWIPETPRSYLPGVFDRIKFAAPVRLVFEKGTHSAYWYSASGSVVGRKTATLSRRSGAYASGWAIINGRPHFLVQDGIWAGYWMPDTTAVWRVW